MRHHGPADFGYGPRVAVEQWQLRPLGMSMQVPRADIEALALLRHQRDRARGLPITNVPGTHAPIVCDRIGVAGELAVRAATASRCSTTAPTRATTSAGATARRAT